MLYTVKKIMGRRAVPKIDPSVDLTGHLYSLDALPCPLSVENLFSTPGPLEIEIGSGKGMFLLNASLHAPRRRWLGVEIAGKYARLAAYRLARAGRRNAVVIAGDAVALFSRYLPDDCAQAVHVYFPDPWWKARHRKRRVMRPQMLVAMGRVLKSGGLLHFWTDVQEYFEATCELIAAQSAWDRQPHVDELTDEEQAAYRTHFERRMRLNDQPIFRSAFRMQKNSKR